MNCLYTSEDSSVYVSQDSPPEKEGSIEEGWTHLLEDTENRMSKILTGPVPEIVKDPEVSEVEDLSGYLAEEYGGEDIKWMEKVETENSSYWNIHARHPEVENGTYIVRIRGLGSETETVIGM